MDWLTISFPVGQSSPVHSAPLFCTMRRHRCLTLRKRCKRYRKDLPVKYRSAAPHCSNGIHKISAIDQPRILLRGQGRKRRSDVCAQGTYQYDDAVRRATCKRPSILLLARPNHVASSAAHQYHLTISNRCLRSSADGCRSGDELRHARGHEPRKGRMVHTSCVMIPSATRPLINFLITPTCVRPSSVSRVISISTSPLFSDPRR